MNLVDITILNEIELRAKVFEAQEVRVQTAPTDLVATGFCHDGPAEARQQRPNHQHRASQRGTLAHELVAAEVLQIHLVGLKGVAALRALCHLHVDVAQQLYQVVHVENVGNIADFHLLVRKQRGTNHLQGLILGSLRSDFALQEMSSFNDK